MYHFLSLVDFPEHLFHQYISNEENLFKDSHFELKITFSTNILHQQKKIIYRNFVIVKIWKQMEVSI